MAQSLPMTSSPPAKRFDWSNLGRRVASALVMVAVAVGATWYGGWAYLVLVSVGVALMSLEWGGMSAPLAPTRVSSAAPAAVLVAIILGFLDHYITAWTAIALGATAAALIARGVAERPADAAFGVLYIAPAALCLVWLRGTHQGMWWTFMLFLATWSA